MKKLLTLIAFAFLTVFTSGSSRAGSYNLQDLGTYGTEISRNSTAQCINDSGLTAGVSYLGDETEFSVGLLYQNGTQTLIPDFPDPGNGNVYGVAKSITGINNSGQIAGTDYTGLFEAGLPFISQNGASVAILGAGTGATSGGINNNGQMTGYVYLNANAFIATTTSYSTLPSYYVGGWANGMGINNANPVEVVGTNTNEQVDIISHATLWKNGIPYLLGGLGGPSSVATAINDQGWVVGYAEVPAVGTDLPDHHAFVWIPTVANGTTGVLHDLGVINGGLDSEALAINNSDQVVGTATASISTTSFIWDSVNGMQDLFPQVAAVNSPLGTSYSIESATGINSRGQISGTASWFVSGYSDFIHHAIILTPAGTAAPAAPANLAAVNPVAAAAQVAGIRPAVTTGGSSNTINLTWTSNSYNETGFVIERETGNSGVWLNLTTTPAFTTVYSDTTCQPSTTYSYEIYATNTIGNSAYSNIATATTGASPITLVSVSVSPTSVVAGTEPVATYTISAAAPTDGVNLELYLDGVDLGGWTVEAGATTSTFTFFSEKLADGTHTASAQFNGTSASATFTVTSDPTLPKVTGLVFSPNPTAVNSTVTGTVTYSSATPVGGATTYITSNGVNLGSFTSPAGVTSATFTLNAGNAGSYTIDAIYNGGLGTTVLVIGSANPAPTLTSISPATGQKGGAAFTLTLNGTSFVSGAVAKWNGTALTTTFVSATKLTAAVPAADLLSAGSQTVTVTNPDTQVSGSQSFTVVNPLPTITTISPTSATAGAAAFTLTVNGTNFLAGAVVQWNGATLTTTFISAAQLTAAVPATDVASQGSATIIVVDPGALASGSATFTIYAAAVAPTITTISPTSATAGAAACTLTVNGTHFLATSVVDWNGVALATTFVSATQLNAAIPATDVASAGTPTVTVVNPGPLTSGGVTFTVTGLAPAPTLTAISPNTAVPGSAGFTMTANGSNFVSGAQIVWNGSAITTTFVSSTTLTAAISSGKLVNPHTIPITVKNPDAQVSGVVDFYTKLPAPTITSIAPNTAVVGGAAFTITVNGTGFVSGAKVQWGGASLTTTFVSATQLTASVLATNIATAGTFNVGVLNADAQTSGTLQFIVGATPTITSLGPASVTAGAASFTLTVIGTNFVAGSTISWNGATLPTMFVSTTSLTANVPAADVATATTASVTVVTPGPFTSNGATFTVNAGVALAPVIASISPNTVVPGSPGFTMTVTGSNFVSGAQVLWNGSAQTTTFVSSTTLTTVITSGKLVNPHTIAITVKNPDTQISNTVNFYTKLPAPALTSLAPNTSVVGGPAFTLTVNGTSFVTGAKVEWAGSVLTTTFVSATQLTASVPAADGATGGTFNVSVLNPDAQLSGTLPFVVGGVTPTITTDSPTYGTQNQASFKLTVNGTSFVSGATIDWNGTPLTTTFVSATQLTATVPASDLTVVGTFPITVVNPGAIVSNSIGFQIKNPAPTITSISPTEVAAGGATFTLTVSGANYLTGAKIEWNGTALTTTFVSSTTLTASIPAADIASAATIPIIVKNSDGRVSGTATFTTTATVVPVSLVFNPSPSYCDAQTSVTLTLDGPAPVGGASVPITANGTTFYTATIPAGSSSTTFTLSWGLYTAATTYTMAAAYNGTSVNTSLTVNPSTITLLSLAYSPSTVKGGVSSNGTVTLSGPAPAGGAIISITGAVTYSFVVPAGATTASYTQPTSVVTISQLYTFNAAYNGATKVGTLTATP